jgi:hypothetical protein
MTPSEFPTRAGLQMPFEHYCRLFLVEFDDDERSPGTMIGVCGEEPVVWAVSLAAMFEVTPT